MYACNVELRTGQNESRQRQRFGVLGSRPDKSLVSAAWAGAVAACVLEKSSKYSEYSCGFSPGALAIALRRRTGIRSTYPGATP
jgi:hypothetical protein